MKYAIQFDFEIFEDGSVEPMFDLVIGESPYIRESFEFASDYWDWFYDEHNTPEIKGLTKGEYHVFAYGNIGEEWSDNWEYGREFDGYICEPEYTKIEKISLEIK